MTIPSNVAQTRNAYYFTRAMLKMLIRLKQNGIFLKNVLCPIPCVGQMHPSTAGYQIDMAFDAVINNDGLIYKIYATDLKELKDYPEVEINSVLLNSKTAFYKSINTV
jgi:hypothetical protein